MSTSTPLTALVLNCTLTPSPAESSTQLLTDQLLEALGKHGVAGESIRVVDLDVRTGVEKDMGDGDAWPGIREKMLAADILVAAVPACLTACQRPGCVNRSVQFSKRPTPTPLGARTIPSGPGAGGEGGACISRRSRTSACR